MKRRPSKKRRTEKRKVFIIQIEHWNPYAGWIWIDTEAHKYQEETKQNKFKDQMNLATEWIKAHMDFTQDYDKNHWRVRTDWREATTDEEWRTIARPIPDQS